MQTCENDITRTETIYPTADYAVEYDNDGQRVYKTLKPDHSSGLQITHVVQCFECQNKRAKPDIQRRLQNAQELENVATEADTIRANNNLAKSLGLSVKLSTTCVQCGGIVGKGNKTKRNASIRGPLCEVCYKEYRRTYMRDFMREVRKPKVEGDTHE